MQGILKTNNIETIGGTSPQGEGINIVGVVEGWVVVDVVDDQISSVQEFDIQPMQDDFVEAINGPQVEGAYNAPAYEVNGFGDKMRFENNPGQVIVGVAGVEDGTLIEAFDAKDDRSQKNFTSDDIKPYKNAKKFIKKFNAKSILRNKIRGNIVDIEDDIADTKISTQMVMYYFANEWQTRTDEQKAMNPAKDNMERLSAKILSDDIKMRADLANGIESMDTIIEKEERINKFVTKNYKFNSQRGT